MCSSCSRLNDNHKITYNAGSYLSCMWLACACLMAIIIVQFSWIDSMHENYCKWLEHALVKGMSMLTHNLSWWITIHSSIKVILPFQKCTHSYRHTNTRTKTTITIMLEDYRNIKIKTDHDIWKHNEVPGSVVVKLTLLYYSTQ